MKNLLTLGLVLATVATMGCREKTQETPKDDAPKEGTNGAASGLKADRGVDVENKIVKLGALNDESGPAVAIGKPYAVGKRVLAEQVNAGGSGLLPDGWKVELVERDHGYNPQKSVQAYDEIKNDVLVIVTSFGTPNTLPLVPKLTQDNMVAMPASLSSKMAESEFTPPVGPAYFFEAMRAMDWAVEDAGGAENVRAGIIYQQDDYGQDGIHGWEQAAEQHGVKIVAQQTVKPGQTDVTAAVKALQDADANYVLLTVLPTGTGPVLGTAAQLQFTPKWIGNTPAWADVFYGHDKLPREVFTKFYVATGLPFWGEESKGMKQFLDAFEKYGNGAPQDWYTLLSYVQGRAALEVAKRAIEAEDVTREGYLRQMATMTNYTADGLIQALDWSKAPYIVSTQTRVLQPDFENKSWKVVSDWAPPKNYEAPAQ